MYFLGLCSLKTRELKVRVSWMLGDSGCIQVSLNNPNVRMSWESQSPAES